MNEILPPSITGISIFPARQSSPLLFFLPVVILLLLITICHLKNSLFMYAIYALALLEINYKNTHSPALFAYSLASDSSSSSSLTRTSQFPLPVLFLHFLLFSPIFFFFFILSHSFNRFHLFCPFCLALFIFGDFSFSLTLNCRHISRSLPRPVTSSIRDSRSGEARKVSPE